MQMQLSEKGVKLLVAREGCELKPYQDVKGLWTVGVGHLLLPNDPYWRVLTQDAAEELFKQDSHLFIANMNNKLTRQPSQDQFDAYVSLSFNIGIGAFNNSTTLKRFNTGDIDGAAEAIKLWNKPKAVIGRRYQEYLQFKGNPNARAN